MPKDRTQETLGKVAPRPTSALRCQDMYKSKAQLSSHLRGANHANDQVPAAEILI